MVFFDFLVAVLRSLCSPIYLSSFRHWGRPTWPIVSSYAWCILRRSTYIIWLVVAGPVVVAVLLRSGRRSCLWQSSEWCFTERVTVWTWSNVQVNTDSRIIQISLGERRGLSWTRAVTCGARSGGAMWSLPNPLQLHSAPPYRSAIEHTPL